MDLLFPRSFGSLALGALALVMLTNVGCSTTHATQAERDQLVTEARAAYDRFKTADPTIESAFEETAVGYAVFPTVGKGGMGLGGAYGKGVLFEGSDVAGYCDLTQGTIGFQLGGQAFSELIFFQTDSALNDFKSGNVEFSAQATAVAANAGAAAKADYENGVAVFIGGEKGLMYEASIGGQGFSYVPKDQVDTE